MAMDVYNLNSSKFSQQLKNVFFKKSKGNHFLDVINSSLSKCKIRQIETTVAEEKDSQPQGKLKERCYSLAAQILIKDNAFKNTSLLLFHCLLPLVLSEVPLRSTPTGLPLGPFPYWFLSSLSNCALKAAVNQIPPNAFYFPDFPNSHQRKEQSKKGSTVRTFIIARRESN